MAASHLNEQCRDPSAHPAVRPVSAQVTTINQATAEEGLEPLATLRDRRSARALGWEAMPKGAVFFATNLVARERGVVRRGDAVEVTALHEGPPAPRSPPQ